jgi:hypothetical protein
VDRPLVHERFDEKKQALVQVKLSYLLPSTSESITTKVKVKCESEEKVNSSFEESHSLLEGKSDT